MARQALICCSSDDISQLMALLDKLFGGYAASGECCLLLCLVGSELIQKFERDNWQWAESYDSAIDELRELAKKIATQVYSASKNNPSFS